MAKGQDHSPELEVTLFEPLSSSVAAVTKNASPEIQKT